MSYKQEEDDICYEVEISDSGMVETTEDSNPYLDMHSYEGYDVCDEQYEEVTCETEDSQGMLMQGGMDDGKFY